jgi:predicted porin
MNFSKKLSLVLLSACFAAASNAESITVYGKANISAQSSDDGGGSFTELKSNASRVGVKGDLALEDNLSVFYTVEWQVDLADSSDSDNIKSRNQYLGLQGDFGKVLIGRNDTMLKQMSGSVDIFNDYEADLKGLWKGENRVSNSVTYVSPSFSGFGFGLTYIAEDSVDGENGVSAAIHYGDNKFKKSNWFAAFSVDSEVNGYDIQRAVVQTKIGSWTIGAIAHKQEAVNSNTSESGITASAQYSIKKWKLKAQYQSLEDDNSISIGTDYKLGNSTKAYAWYTNRGLDQSEDKSWLAVGLEHKF